MMALLLTWLCWPWLAWRARAARATPVRRILLIQTAKIGDMLCATPVIAALRAAYPHAELTVLHDPITPAASSPTSRACAVWRSRRGRFAAWPAAARCCVCCATASTTPC